MFRAWFIAAALALSAPASCGSAQEPAEYDDPDITLRDVNADGVPYPSDRLGARPRVRDFPGDRIPNMTFRAYVDGDTSELKTISLADYYDPQSKRSKLLHIQVAAIWCALCSNIVEATLRVKEPLRAEGVVYLEVMVSGPTQFRGPSIEDVTGWIGRHRSTLTTAIDVRSRRLSSIGIDGSIMPYDLEIDLRTMEILDSSGGAPADVAVYDRSFLRWIDTHPPSY